MQRLARIELGESTASNPMTRARVTGTETRAGMSIAETFARMRLIGESYFDFARPLFDPRGLRHVCPVRESSSGAPCGTVLI